MTADARKTKRHQTPGRSRKTFPGAPATQPTSAGAIAYFDASNDLQGATLAAITSAGNMLLAVAAELRFRSDATSYRIYSPSAASLNIEGAILVKVGATGADVTVGNGSGDTVAITARSGSTVDCGTTTLPWRNGAWTGSLQKKAGTSTTWAQCGGTMKVDTTAVGNTGTGADDNLIQYTVPASTLSTAGDTLHFVMSGTTAGATTKRIKAFFDTNTLIDTTALAFGTSDWMIEGWISRVDATNQKAIVRFQSNAAALTTTVDYTTPNRTLANSLVLKATGNVTAGGAANDIQQQHLIVDYLPGQ